MESGDGGCEEPLWLNGLLLPPLIPVLPPVSQGVKQSDHFGFICRDHAESGPGQYGCYVFQCASESLVSHAEHYPPTSPLKKTQTLVFLIRAASSLQVDEVMLTLNQAFTTAAALQSNKTQIQLCEACPMHDLHKLCERIEGEPPPPPPSRELWRSLTHGGVGMHVKAGLILGSSPISRPLPTQSKAGYPKISLPAD